VKIGMVAVFAILAAIHLSMREYPFGGTTQTVLDILMIVFAAIVVGTLITSLTAKKQNEADPPGDPR
jgi:hypothetical protein